MRIVLFTIILLFMISGLAMAVKDPDLIIYFPFEEINGKVVADQSENGHDGDINGNIKIVDNGKRGKAAEFQSGDFIDMHGPDFPADQLPKTAITICAWVNCKKTGDHHEIFNAQAGDATWVVHPEVRSDGTFRWLLRTDGGATIFDFSAGAVEWEKWMHYAGVYDGKKGTLYINGENVGEGNGGVRLAKDWGSGARVGRTIDNARPFTGLMDDLNIWKRALTKDEILVIMEKGPEGIIKSESVSPTGSVTTKWGQLKSH
ncbi:MAG: LamG protein [Candidatus Poribacteria bacterium]|nr:LamG protein [Candidatus Poribacteria bacterium]